jgi:uncharacterized protein YecE (DUF72 family)
MLVLVGTSGYQYDFWKNNFYPDKLKKDNYLNYYSQYFDAVEINYTFYKYPMASTVKSWYESTPSNFKFIVKMNMLITHYKKLKNVTSEINKFMNIINKLKQKLAGVLFQMSDSFKYNADNLGRIAKASKLVKNCAFELRDSSWYNNDVYGFFRANAITLVTVNVSNDWFYLKPGFHPSLKEDKFTDTLYFRLHGPKSKYTGSYDARTLHNIVKYIKKQKPKKVFIMFNNTDSIQKLPDAVHDALRMLTII